MLKPNTHEAIIDIILQNARQKSYLYTRRWLTKEAKGLGERGLTAIEFFC
jgi:hypothetical protein